MMIAQQVVPMLEQLPGLGVAGLMGAMWLWERRTSAAREKQLDDAHERIVQDRVQLDALVDLVRQNTQAMTRLTALLEGGSRHASAD
jgi:hypothetical protein